MKKQNLVIIYKHKIYSIISNINTTKKNVKKII